MIMQWSRASLVATLQQRRALKVETAQKSWQPLEQTNSFAFLVGNGHNATTQESLLLGAIPTAISPIATHFSVTWSVVCRLTHSCTLLKPFNRFGCHLAGTLVGYKDALCRMGVPNLPGEGRFWGRTPNQNMQLLIPAATWRMSDAK